MRSRSDQKLKMKNTAMFERIGAEPAKTLCPLYFYFALPLRSLRLCGDIFKT